jgi:hypothetical protein
MNQKLNNYKSDPNKIYEKYRIISNMEDYLAYLNAFKRSDNEGSSSYSRKPYTNYKYDKDNSSYRKKRYNRDQEFKDLDEPEINTNIAISDETKPITRKLISYDDL